MSAVKTLILSVLIMGVSGSLAHAEPMISNGVGSWSFWSSGGAPVTPTTALAVATPAPPVPTPTPPPVAVAAATYTVPTAAPVPPPAPRFSNPIPPGGTADAYLNFSTGPYPEASLMTTGGAQPWFTSPVVEKLYGGQAPNTQQQADFTNAVLDHVNQTFQLSGGLAPKITLDPSIPANHTLSVVSNTSYGANPNAIGITDVGNSGFSFIDKLSYGSSINELEWAVAHNVSHELMHAFGVSGHDDQSGNYLDAASAKWELLTSPTTRFSDAAIADIKARAFAPSSSGFTAGGLQLDGDLEILASPVPEPTTWALWGLALSAAVVQRRRQLRRKTN
ncbi:PEP-CTERM protein-sorting domain-containing protein [Singulisphaera sp. GP187]|uniref:PEP-CTERM sorting domain-containing protein n=1 Tax=Singulisphaera sp. GP187 TaxID=1882752 RepID=UPI00092CC446|nr:PEP-CTERM sorting domain-containing protein [Singulisphaera sp. GP187]SIO62274.1 PEP-CTERM protein-sorting domain-containing protein [Singulisphaera sp. GP187]